jgi:vitamin B12 transporter
MRSSSSRLAVAISICLASLAFSAAASAQQPVQLPGIYVQGATLEAPQAPPGGGDDAGGVPLDKIGSAVTVVTGEQLRAQQVRHAADALRSLPGVHVSQTGGFASFTQVRLRGAEGNHTLVLIDGIRANGTSDGEFDFADLLVEEIERIEVIRGPHSGLYGSGAIGGVVNVVTKTGKGPPTATVRFEGGGYGTAGISARVSGGTDRAWIALSAQHRSQEFFNLSETGSEEDPWRNTTVSLKGGITLMDGLAVDFTLRNTRRFLNQDALEVPPGGVFRVATDAPDTADNNLFLGGINLKWDTLGGALTHVVRASRNITDQKTLSAFGPGENLGEADKLGYLATYRFNTPMFLAARHSISGLLEREFERFTPGPPTPGPFGPDGIQRDRTRLATVAEYRGEFFDRVTLTGTVRHDDNDKFADYTTWRTALSLALHEYRMRPHASVGTAVALPGMFEQFGSVLGLFVGNPNLKPEQSFGWDAGIEFTLVPNRVLLDITYFQADLTDEIRGFGTTLTNLAGESERRGVELALRAQVMPSLLLGASYTYLDASEPDGRPEVRRPRHAGRGDLTYRFAEGRGTVNLAAIYNGTMKDDAFDLFFNRALVTLDDYWLVNAAVSYKLEKGVEVFTRVENALNSQYQEVFGFNTPGITAFAGVRFTFGGPDGYSGN